MNKEAIKLVKESIKNCGDTRTTLEATIKRLNEETKQAERDLFRANNVRQSFEAALKCLEEAEEKEVHK
ncbi:unnamed protein product [marine sediment metagenome]|uniref:Uncharacterized protein n=1 Tax=marine sediment metagenome TaxID=412755 RepID=X1JV55_9ZZZZ